MSFDSLCQKINYLSSKVETLLDNEDETDCANLLIQRQKLLEQLKQSVDEIKNQSELSLQQQKLHTFLRTIQTRDNLIIQSVKDKAQQLLGQGSQQAKGNKAIKAYRSVF